MMQKFRSREELLSGLMVIFSPGMAPLKWSDILNSLNKMAENALRGVTPLF